MFKVKVITVGKCKEKWLEMALFDYEKRMLGQVEFEWLLLRNEKELLKWSEANEFIALDPNGKLFTSEKWSQEMNKMGLRLNFLIGGSLGLEKKILQKAKTIWSLSPLTFTHQMTRLILIEQIYRALEIEKGSKYHKA